MMLTMIRQATLALLLMLLCTAASAQFCSGTTSLTTISGIITDGSGPSDYANNSSCEWVIEPPGVTSVTLTFTFFNLLPGDVVRVYDGNSSAAPLLGTFTGSSLPAPITTLGTAMFVEFTTNASGTAEGWNAIYSTTSNGLYWIGDGGDWNDPAHWSTSSGGTSCGCVPTANDNVFFDANSFSSFLSVVNIDADAFCKDMNWLGTTNYPLLDGSQDIFVFGSLLMSNQFFSSFTGDFIFEADAGNHVVFGNGNDLGDVTFQGLDGTWELIGDLEASNLTHTDGNILTGNFDLEITNYISNTANSRHIDWGTSEVRFYGFSSAWLLGVTNYSMDASASHFIFENGTTSSFPSLSGNNLLVNKATFNGQRGSISGLRRINEVVFNGSVSGNVSSCDTVVLVDFKADGLINGSPMLIQQMTVSEDGTFSGNQTINNITLTPGKTYNFGSGFTMTLNGTVNIAGSCDEPIIVQKSGSTNATIQRAGGTLTLDQVRLRGISTSGGATFNATNCTDLGDNIGWNITNPAAQTLYWIGGEGAWEDPANWSTTSGGISTGCIPTPYDDVIFDGNSFSFGGQGVNLNETAYCRSMDWSASTNEPALRGGTNLNIYGSLRLHPDINFLYDGDIAMLAQSGSHQIFTEGKFLEEISFDGDGGTWTLQDSLSTGVMRMLAGSLFSNNQPISVNSFNSNSTTPAVLRYIDLGTSTVHVFSNGSSWTATASGLDIDGQNATLILEFLPTSLSAFPTVSGSQDYGEIIFKGNDGQVSGVDSIGVLTFEGTNNGRITNTNFVGVLNANGNAIFSSSGFCQQASINGNGDFNGNWIFDFLQLAPASDNSFQAFTTTTVNSQFNAVGNCTELLNLHSSSTSNANLDLSTAIVNIEYASVRDLTAVGGTYTANNSIDAGGNSGWTINSPAPLTLYWVGTSGDWTDPSNWSFSSGGAGGACVPSSIDNVVFDDNGFTTGVSGQAVVLNADGFCHDMTWNTSAANPVFLGLEDLYISGSLNLSADLDFLHEGFVYFTSNSPGETISTAAKNFNDNIYFEGSGSWQLLDDMTVDASVYLNEGNLELGSNFLRTNFFYSTTLNPRSLDLGTGEINLSNTFQLDNSNISVSALGGTIRFTELTGNFYGNGFSFGNVISEATNFNVFDNNSIIDLDLKKNARFWGSNTIGSLRLYPNFEYTFNSGFTTTILNELYATGVAGGPVKFINSSGTPHTIFKTSGAVCLDYTSLQGITATGGAFFFAGANAIDLGNNSGWFYTSCSDACPQILDVATTFVGPTTATLDWYTPVANYQYQVRVREIGTLPWNNINLIPGAHDFYNLTGLSNTVDYEWQVRQVCEPTYTLISEWSDTLSFNAKCNPPSDLATDIILSKAVRVQWVRASEATFYEIRGRRVGTPAFTSVNLPPFPFYFDKAGLGPGQTFEWQMRTFCDPGGSLVSDWSTLNVFTTPSGRTGEEVEVSVYPNPFNTHITVAFNLPFEQPQPIRLFDLMGRVLYETSSPGGESIRIPRNDLPAGNYFLQIGAEDPQVIQLQAN